MFGKEKSSEGAAVPVSALKEISSCGRLFS